MAKLAIFGTHFFLATTRPIMPVPDSSAAASESPGGQPVDSSSEYSQWLPKSIVGDGSRFHTVIAGVADNLGVQYRKTKDISAALVQRSWRALTGNSTATEVEHQAGFFGIWDATLPLRVDVTTHVGKLCASLAGLRFNVLPNFGSVVFSDDAVPSNLDYFVAALVGAPCSGKSSATAALRGELQRLCASNQRRVHHDDV